MGERAVDHYGPTPPNPAHNGPQFVNTKTENDLIPSNLPRLLRNVTHFFVRHLTLRILLVHTNTSLEYYAEEHEECRRHNLFCHGFDRSFSMAVASVGVKMLQIFVRARPWCRRTSD